MATKSTSSTVDKSKIAKLLDRISQPRGKGPRESAFLRIDPKQKYVLRLLPDIEKDPVKMYAQHYKMGRTFVCPKETYGKDCPACDFIAKNFKKSSKEVQAKFKEIGASRRFYSLVLNRSDNKVYIWSYSEKVAVKLLQYLNEEEEYGEICHPEYGRDISLSVLPTQTDKRYPEYEVTLRMNTSPVVPKEKNAKELDQEKFSELMENLPSIEKEMRFLEYGEIEQALIDWSKKDEEESKSEQEPEKNEGAREPGSDDDEPESEGGGEVPSGDLPF